MAADAVPLKPITSPAFKIIVWAFADSAAAVFDKNAAVDPPGVAVLVSKEWAPESWITVDDARAVHVFADEWSTVTALTVIVPPALHDALTTAKYPAGIV